MSGTHDDGYETCAVAGSNSHRPLVDLEAELLAPWACDGF